MSTNVPAGWYIPAGGPPRFWDGAQWLTDADPAGDEPAGGNGARATPRRDWVQRHPALTTAGALWLITLLAHWHWLGPTLVVVAALVWAVRWTAGRSARLAAAAERQNALAAEGDPRGIYGDFPPADAP